MEAIPGSKPAPGEANTAQRGATGVVVLGAGRSGTSAITRAFVAAGFFAGREDQLLGAAPSNPLGHYEPLPVLEMNERLLERLGSGAPGRDAQLRLRTEVGPQLRAILEALVADSDGAPLAIKEPRINRLLPLWGPVIEGMLHPVLAVRDPLEVAHSMTHRYGTPVGHALALWEVQTTFALEWLNGKTVTVAPYVELMADPELASRLVGEAAPHLSPERAKRARPGDASTALRPDLRTQSAAEGAHAEYLTQRQAELWRYMEKLPAGDVELSVPRPLREPSAGGAAAVLTEDERVKLLGDHGALSTAYTEALARSTELEGRFSDAHHAGLRAAEGEERALRELESIKASLSWRLTAPLRRLTRLRRS